MSEPSLGMLLAIACIGVPQVLGFAASRLFRSERARVAVWPLTASLVLALGWAVQYAQWSAEARHRLDAGQFVCGTGIAALTMGFVMLLPAEIVVGVALAAILEHATRGAERRPSAEGPDRAP
jgi:hypothetical protein